MLVVLKIGMLFVNKPKYIIIIIIIIIVYRSNRPNIN